MSEVKLVERDGGNCSAVAQADGDPRALVPPVGMNGRVQPRHPIGGVPEYTIDALIDYVEHGRAIGSFLSAVLVGDLFGTFRSADHSNRERIEAILRWLRNVPPARCYGSELNVAAWRAMNPGQRSVALKDCPSWQDFMARWES
ncbi:MAG: hypothetical protein V3T08_09225 [Gemmatimonadota bacterium]